MRKSLIACLLLSSSALSFAQDNTASTDMSGWNISGLAAIVNIDDDTARAEFIDSEAYTISFSADYRQNAWLTSITADFFVYDDNAEFSQTVIGDGVFNDGDISIESSDANAFGLSVATGYEWRFGEAKRGAASLQGGFTGVFQSERSIANCDDCFSEDIDVDGGAFIMGKLSYNLGAVELGLHHRQYLGGDGLKSITGIQISSVF